MQKFKFPAGEIGVRHGAVDDHHYHQCLFKSHDDLFEMALACDAARRMGAKKITLEIPYFPYARQDRVCNEGESLSVKVMADFVNSIQADEVIVYDPHSDVVSALVHNIKIIEQHKIVPPNLLFNKTVVCPDAGAEKKILKLKRDYIMCRKVRKTGTGAIVNTTVDPFDPAKNYIIVDDICDGGRTFIAIAEKMREMGLTGELHLFVTHGIFSKGFEELCKHFDTITCLFDLSERN